MDKNVPSSLLLDPIPPISLIAVRKFGDARRPPHAEVKPQRSGWKSRRVDKNPLNVQL
jgi:hypothetical protein